MALKQKELGTPPKKRLLQFKLADSNELLFHEEPIFADGKPVGVITSGMFGHRVNASLGMGYVKLDQPITADLIAEISFEIGVGDRRVKAEAQLCAWYDSRNARIRG